MHADITANDVTGVSDTQCGSFALHPSPPYLLLMICLGVEAALYYIILEIFYRNNM